MSSSVLYVSRFLNGINHCWMYQTSSVSYEYASVFIVVGPLIHRMNLVLRKSGNHSSVNSKKGDEKKHPGRKLDLTDQYISILLAILVECGIVEVRKCFDQQIMWKQSPFLYFIRCQALADLVNHGVSALSRKVNLLLGEVLRLANQVLPSKYCVKVQASRTPWTLPSSYLIQMLNGIFITGSSSTI